MGRRLLHTLARLSPTELSRRFDSSVRGWYNEVTGYGTDRDKTAFGGFAGVALLSETALSALYHGDDIAARMVDIVPDEMLREGFEVSTGDADRDTDLAERMDELEVGDKIANAMRWGRLYGAGALLIGADDGRPAAAELIPERARGVSYLYELDRRYLFPLTWYSEPGHPKIGQPETYIVNPTSSYAPTEMAIVHESRLLMFGGATTGIQERQQNHGFDHSVLQRAYEALRSFNTGWKSVEILLSDASQAVFKVAGLSEQIGADGEEAVQMRMRLIDMYRSVLRAIVVDAGSKDEPSEEFQRHNATFSDIPNLLDRHMMRIAAAVEMPVTILFGRSPAGMNATGDADFRWFYDRMKSAQTRKLAPSIIKLARIMLRTRELRSSTGEPAKLKANFPPLWTETPSTQAATRKTMAEADAVYVNAGVVTPEEVALHRLRPNGFDEDLVLTKDGREARESSLEDELERLESGAPDESDQLEGPAPPPFPPAPATASPETEPPELGDESGDPTEGEDETGDDEETRADSAELLDALDGHRRVIIAGGPRSGKTILGARASERYGLPLRSTDSLIESTTWGDDSARVAEWFDELGDWIIEGPATARALRKWIRRNEGKTLNATVVWMPTAKAARTKGQASMARGVETVWRQVRPQLEQMGVTILVG